MTNRRYSERTLTPSTNPLTGMALIGVSTTADGGSTYNASIKATFDEFVEWLLDNGIPIDDDLIVVGTGTGIKGSNMKAGGVVGDTNNGYLAYKDYHNFTDYALFQDRLSGYTQINSKAGQSVIISLANGIKLKAQDGVAGGIIMSQAAADSVAIGGVLGGEPSKLDVQGANDLNIDYTLTTRKQTASAGEYTFSVTNDGFVTLESGTSVNEISDDSDFSGATNDQLKGALAIKDFVEGLVTPQIIGGVTLSSSSSTNILNGTYVILADTTTVTSVTSGVGQDSNWTLEVTQAGITNQKGVVTFTGNLEKDGGGGVNYDIAIFKNGSIVSESEQVDQKLESGGKGQSVTVMAITEFSTNDTFDIRVAGNGTAEDIFCGGGSLYLK